MSDPPDWRARGWSGSGLRWHRVATDDPSDVPARPRPALDDRYGGTWTAYVSGMPTAIAVAAIVIGAPGHGLGLVREHVAEMFGVSVFDVYQAPQVLRRGDARDPQWGPGGVDWCACLLLGCAGQCAIAVDARRRCTHCDARSDAGTWPECPSCQRGAIRARELFPAAWLDEHRRRLRARDAERRAAR